MGIEAGWGIKAGEGIEAGWGIKAGEGIEAGGGIEAGKGINAGGCIEADWDINAGFSIVCKTIRAKLRIFAGLVSWRVPTDEELQIRCEELLEGTVAFGELVLIPKTQEEK